MKCPKIQVTLTPEMLENVKKLSAATGNSVAAVIRMAVAEYVLNKQRVVINGTDRI